MADIFSHSSPLSTVFKFLAALAFLGLAAGQLHFDKQGEGGERRMKF